MKVLKFGGSSVGSPNGIKNVKSIIEGEKSPCIVVVSAFQGVTDNLLNIFETAKRGDEEYTTLINSLAKTHKHFITTLFTDTKQQNALFSYVDSIFSDINETAYKVFSKKSTNLDEDRDSIAGVGELLSSKIISAFIPGSSVIDSREIIKSTICNKLPEVDFVTTNKLAAAKLKDIKGLVIMPGYVASTPSGAMTTLGRGGSDYTASIIAAAIGADILEIWTDVDGFMTADPKKVEKAYTINSLTYSEAMELSHFGAKVIYSPTLRPVYKNNIPILVKNTFNPKAEGTIITQESKDKSRSNIKGISSIDDIDLITIQGPSMVGVSGVSARLFGVLAKNNISVILITQASSEYSISFAVRPDDSDIASKVIMEEFKQEISDDNGLKVHVEKNLSIIAIVGARMRHTPGVSATLFSSLGKNGINTIAIAQGYSELNISVVIKKDHLKKALNVVHDNFFLSSYMEINLFVVGVGVVGGSLLKQLTAQHDLLFNEHNLKVNLLGVANYDKMIIDNEGIPLAKYQQILEEQGEVTDLDFFISQIKKFNRRNSVFVDCTASADVASKYAEVLSSYTSIVAANKIACSSEYEYYHTLKQIAYEKSVKFMYETTVGAGLPIIKTIQDLILSGDKILKIEAVLSGTLNFIFNEISSTMPLSKAIRRAREMGYSEPDPRIDLSGTDVIRKILILAREAGYKLEKSDVEVNNFLPADCFEGSLDDFYAKVELLDKDFEEKRAALAAQGKRWRFFATLDNGKAKVGLVEIDIEHPSYNLAGSNNIIIITTERYKELPMVIKGYGAGAAVTSAGVFADLMRVMNV
ncbi:MAG: bifunctional aspartate kinase/homoserine dehydrogenase I [Bacteroidales bacterium]|nr:bifunctional aspartate kinase/homoserine dehydrogenase I [Bacteroidales bacterium]